MSDAEVIIYHNPKCGTSRNTLEKIRAADLTFDAIASEAIRYA